MAKQTVPATRSKKGKKGKVPAAKRTGGRGNRKLPLILAGVGVVAMVVVAVLIIASQLGGGDDAITADAVEGAAETQALLNGIPQEGIALGDPDAPVTLAEYADLQCPHCADWTEANFAMIVDEYVRPGNVRLEYRGLAFIGTDSQEALRTAHAAGDQNKLWNFTELTFQNQGEPNSGWVTDDSMRAIGSSIPGLNTDLMMEARDADEVQVAITVAEGQAESAGINATPTFQVGLTGGALVVVDLNTNDQDAIRAILDDALADVT